MANCMGKPINYFIQKAEPLKNCRLDSMGMWAKENKSVLEALYRIAQAKKPHTIGKKLVKLCLIEAATRSGNGRGKS